MFIKAIAAGTAWLFMATGASAHHAMDGQLPDTLMGGLLSGLGHPVIGWDHLAFVVGIGILSMVAGLGVAPILCFVLATVAGCLLHVLGADLPAAEVAIALSILALAALLVVGWRRVPALLALVALAGVFHGYAYGESIVGAEATPLLAYLVGFALIQAAIAIAAARLAAWIAAGSGARAGGLAQVSGAVLVLVAAAALLG
ncbi:urease accessory protein [Stella humosa]|uniref:Urease accessory protein n=1 Tax=Stella humosa TaxID=94 RepID=A0A3N1KYT4_9PROT|nr:HupE/UreJ family protein [Stella humosa]ROP84582.1 urease accessory protein [Stella humosa]BBK34102.1 hypothetical protein STHU_47360 [Stella humosa]